jgi:hypothetical protein
MAQFRVLSVTVKQRHELEAARDHDERPYVRERAAALLKIAEGETCHAVACQGLLKPRDPDTVYGWLDIYEQGGLAGLIARQHGGVRRRSL